MGARGSNTAYVEILRWFADFPGLPYVYSIHNMIQCGMKYDKLPGEWYGPSTAAFVLRDLTRLHHRKHTGELEVYVTTGDTIYISDVNKLCTDTTANNRHANSSNNGNGDESAAGDRMNTLKTSLSAAVLQTETTTPCSSAADHDVQSKSSSSTSTPVPFFDPLLHVPPNSTTEKPWNCSLLVIIPLKLGVYNVSEAYREEVKKVLRHRNSVGILGGRPNHAIYFVGYSVAAGAGTGATVGSATIGAGSTQLVGLDPHTVYSTNHYTSEPFPSPELCSQIHPAVIPYFSCFDNNDSNGKSPPCSAATSAYESMCVPPTELAIEQLDPSIALGFYFRTKLEFEAFCNEKNKNPKRSGEISDNAGTSSSHAFSFPTPSSTTTSVSDSTPSVLYNIEYAEPSYDFSMYEQEDDGDELGGGSCGGEGLGRERGCGADSRNDEDKDDEYVFI